MDLVYTTMLIYLGINALGLVWTAGIIQFGVPERLSIQNRPHKWSILGERLPRPAEPDHLDGLVWTALTLFGDIFTMARPGWEVLALQVGIIVVLDDAWFYLWHRPDARAQRAVQSSPPHSPPRLRSPPHRVHLRAPDRVDGGRHRAVPGSRWSFLVWGIIPAWTLWAYLLVRNLHELDIHSGIISPLGKLMPDLCPRRAP